MGNGGETGVTKIILRTRLQTRKNFISVKLKKNTTEAFSYLLEECGGRGHIRVCCEGLKGVCNGV